MCYWHCAWPGSDHQQSTATVCSSHCLKLIMLLSTITSDNFAWSSNRWQQRQVPQLPKHLFHVAWTTVTHYSMEFLMDLSNTYRWFRMLQHLMLPGNHGAITLQGMCKKTKFGSDSVFIARQHIDARHWYSKSVRLSVRTQRSGIR